MCSGRRDASAVETIFAKDVEANRRKDEFHTSSSVGRGRRCRLKRSRASSYTVLGSNPLRFSHSFYRSFFRSLTSSFVLRIVS